MEEYIAAVVDCTRKVRTEHLARFRGGNSIVDTFGQEHSGYTYSEHHKTQAWVVRNQTSSRKETISEKIQGNHSFICQDAHHGANLTIS